MCRLQWHLMQVWFGVCSLHGAMTCRAWCYDIPIQLCHLCPSRHTATARGEQPCPVLWPWHWLGTAVFPHLSPIYPCHLEYWCHTGIPSMQETPWRLATGAGGLREQMEDLGLGFLRDCLVHYILLAWRPSIWHTEPGLAGLLLLRGDMAKGMGAGNWERHLASTSVSSSPCTLNCSVQPCTMHAAALCQNQSIVGSHPAVHHSILH